MKPFESGLHRSRTSASITSVYSEADHSIYIYDAARGVKGQVIKGVSLPGWVVRKTLEMLRDRENDTKAKMDEADWTDMTMGQVRYMP